MRPRVTAVIVDYHQAENVARAVLSVRGQYDPALLEIVVVDNSVSEANAARLHGLSDTGARVIVNESNLGYAAACNLGAIRGRGDYILLINPDIQWHEDGALERLVEFLEDQPSVAIVAPQQFNEDGSRPSTVRQFPTLRAQLLRRTLWRHLPPFARMVEAYEVSEFDYSRSQSVAWVQSSCVLIRRGFWDRIGGFDWRYFLFMADVDVCRTAWEEGWEVWLMADAAVMANGRRASEGGTLDLFRSPALRRHLFDAGRYYWKRRVHPRRRPVERARLSHDWPSTRPEASSPQRPGAE